MGAVRLAEDVWLVGTGEEESSAFTDAYDCHQFLVTRGGAGVLVDTGTGRGIDRLLANLAEVLPLEQVHLAVVTHAHLDHAGGSAALRRRGVRVLAGGRTAELLAVGDEQGTALAPAREAGVYPPDYRLEPARVEVVTEGARLDGPWGTLEVLETPGHCDGHLSLRLEHTGTVSVFVGDTIFAGGTVAVQPIADCRPAEYARSTARLAALRAERLFPGHGEVVLSEAWRDTERAAAAFARLLMPPNRLAPWQD